MIYIVRHGQTDLNGRNVLQGRSNHHLNSAGILQAQQVAQLLKGTAFETVYSSPLIRAVETAEIIAPDKEPVIDERLIEMDYGPYEGMDLRSPVPEIVTFFSDFVHNPAPEGMEQLSDVVERAGSFLEERCRTGEDILISTHAIAMKGILEYLDKDQEGSYWSKFIGNCAVYTTEYLPDGSWSRPKEMVD